MKITAILLNYKRPTNLVEVIKSIRLQTEPIQILLWNNGDEALKFDVDLQINSSKNLVCMPRWYLATLAAETEYIFVMDDDLKLIQKDIIAKCINKISCKNNIIGPYGIKITKNQPYYTKGHDISLPQHDTKADIIKGRFMFMRRNLLKNVNLVYDYKITREDDIYISLKTLPFAKHHTVSSIFKDAFQELPKLNTGLEYQAEHYKERNAFVKYMLEKELELKI